MNISIAIGFVFLFFNWCNISHAQNGVRTFQKDDLYGLIDSDSNVIVPASYAHILDLRHDFFAVKVDGKIGLMNSQGSMLLPPNYQKIDKFSRQGFAVIESVLKDSTGNDISKFGIIDTSASFIVFPKYEMIERITKYNKAIYKDNGKYGVIDDHGIVLVEPIWEEVTTPNRKVYYVKIGDKIGLLDRKLEKLVDVQFEEIGSFHGCNCEIHGADAKLAKFKLNGKFGYLSSKGNIMVDPIYDEANDFSQGFASVSKNGKWGFLNTKNEVSMPFTYEDAGTFSGDTTFKAPVKIGDKYGFISISNEVVIEPIYDTVMNFAYGRAVVQIDGKWGYIDEEGKLVIPAIYDKAYYFYKTIAKVKLDGKYIKIDNFGNEL